MLYGSGSTEETEDDHAQSSLDMQGTAKLALRRRASDGIRTQLGVNLSDNRWRNGSITAVEQVGNLVWEGR